MQIECFSAWAWASLLGVLYYTWHGLARQDSVSDKKPEPHGKGLKDIVGNLKVISILDSFPRVKKEEEKMYLNNL